MANQETIAILGGTGDLGLGLALRWAAAGVSVIIGSRDEVKAKDAAAGIFSRLVQEKVLPEAQISVAGHENAKAASMATVVVLAVPFPAQAGILKSIKTSMKDCIFVDATVPLEATVGGKPTRMLGIWEGSAAERARSLVPSEIPVLAAFHNVSAESLQHFDESLDCDILVCGDDAAAKKKLSPLVELIPGLRALDAGPLEMSRIVEGMTALLISLNRQHKVRHSGIRITGIGTDRQ